MAHAEMKALVKAEAGKGLVLQKMPIPQVGVGEVKIKVLKTAICGTDLHIYNWDAWSQRTIRAPLIAGHEFVGQIVEVGPYTPGYQVGEIVSGEGHIVCNTCRNCRAGRRHLCKNTIGVGVNRDGAFAEYLVLPYENVVRLDADIPLETAACFDPLGNAVHTALKFNLVGEDVLITGAGPIGIMAAIVCKHCGAKNIVVTDMNDFRLQIVRGLAGVQALDIREDTVANMMKRLGMKEGFDVGLEMSGSEAAFAEMIENMNSGGKVALLGIQNGNTRINWDKVMFNGLTIQGIYGREMFETWYKMISMVQMGLDISPVITHRFHYTDYEKGFHAMNSGKSCKVVLDWAEV